MALTGVQGVNLREGLQNLERTFTIKLTYDLESLTKVQLSIGMVEGLDSQYVEKEIIATDQTSLNLSLLQEILLELIAEGEGSQQQ